jgi:hypothetical protein
MSGTLNALNRTVRWDAYLHRSARCAYGKLGKQRTYGITKQLAAWFTASVEFADGGDDRLEIRVRTGHVGTIRPLVGSLCVGPAFRRTIRQGIVASGASAREVVKTGRRWT